MYSGIGGLSVVGFGTGGAAVGLAATGSPVLAAALLGLVVTLTGALLLRSASRRRRPGRHART